jgi:transketolase
VDLTTKSVNTLRLLAVDAVEAAKSGHPGLPLGAAPMAYTVWTKHLRFNPANPSWPGRDRFILSAGHGSALLYSLLHLFGYPEMTIAELKRFRQLDSITPGHPEYGHTPGVEATTGPLGQGISNAVGIALAERHLAATLNRDGFEVVDFHTYVIASDGDLMEGVSAEASSFAGHLKLNRLIVLYDDNHISIDGPTSLSFTEDVGARYRAYGWNVVEVADGNDLDAIDKAITLCKEVTDRPSLIRVRTVIGYGSPHKAGTADVHGSPLGAEETKLVKEFYGFDPEQSFVVDDDVRGLFEAYRTRGAELESEYKAMITRYREAHPDVAEIFDAWTEGMPDPDWDELLPLFPVGDGMATRASSGKVLDVLAPAFPLMIGGSADLTPSNNTRFQGAQDLSSADYSGRYIHYGVREHAMGAIMNGMSVTGLIPYGGTFLIFSDYMRPAIRLAALSGYRTIFVFTHDSIGLGEDGPTHQPVEHYAALRAIPNLQFIRPADANETAFAWRMAIERSDGPTALALTRQTVPTLPGTESGDAMRGGYILRQASTDPETPDVILVATGSEVHLVMKAAEILEEQGYTARVVSMPCCELFDMQEEEYTNMVFPELVTSIAVEAGVTFGWDRYAEMVIGIDHFGTSAPGDEAMKEYGFTPEAIAGNVAEYLDAISSQLNELL